MVLSSITYAIIAVVEGSWIASSIFLKYYISGLVVKNLYQDSLNSEEFIEEIMESSELVVSLLIVSGAVIAVSNLSLTPLVKLFSEIIALGYFGLLFWKY